MVKSWRKAIQFYRESWKEFDNLDVALKFQDKGGSNLLLPIWMIYEKESADAHYIMLLRLKSMDYIKLNLKFFAPWRLFF